ncbi:hypothetical protein DUI87_23910 [Hirundo rustica rustica]|uniref:Uncharacterized protein n=1 Tax=Hirundo rustica rustica TaxID=333673 RepID=A0A3M0JXM2_HIRRU|nr:hypothetical protein DUI87_23910 [Hirundo rustica rustica]
MATLARFPSTSSWEVVSPEREGEEPAFSLGNTRTDGGDVPRRGTAGPPTAQRKQWPRQQAARGIFAAALKPWAGGVQRRKHRLSPPGQDWSAPAKKVPKPHCFPRSLPRDNSKGMPRYQSSYAGLGICFHLLNTNRRIFKPPFDPDMCRAGYTTGRPAFVSPRILCCKWETLHAEPAGLREAGIIPMSGSATASQLPSLTDEFFLIPEVLPGRMVVLVLSSFSLRGVECKPGQSAWMESLGE